VKLKIDPSLKPNPFFLANPLTVVVRKCHGRVDASIEMFVPNSPGILSGKHMPRHAKPANRQARRPDCRPKCNAKVPIDVIGDLPHREQLNLEDRLRVRWNHTGTPGSRYAKCGRARICHPPRRFPSTPHESPAIVFD
jgi:hypothetical protein